MDLEEFIKATKGKNEGFKIIVREYEKHMIEIFQKEYNCNKDQAKFLIYKSLMYNLVKNQSDETINFLNEEKEIINDFERKHI